MRAGPAGVLEPADGERLDLFRLDVVGEREEVVAEGEIDVEAEGAVVGHGGRRHRMAAR